MSLSLILACLWAVAANVIGMFPSKRNHWPAAYVLIALGIPLLGFITLQHGPWIGADDPGGGGVHPALAGALPVPVAAPARSALNWKSS